MSELLTSAQMRAVEQAAIASGIVTGAELMERAGQGVAQAIAETWGDLDGKMPHVAVFCGPGNNGGDGFVIARLLKAQGWAVSLFFAGTAERLPPDARANHDRWAGQGEVQPMSAASRIVQTDLVIDALFGTGLSRPVAPELIAPLKRLSDTAPLVAVDIASGLDADSGRPLGACCRADLTVTFHRAKLGHMLAEGPTLSDCLVIHDIGLSDVPPNAPRPSTPAPLGKTIASHKYGHGHALVLAGGAGKGGAARLAARGALRVGAGLVTVAPTPGALQENAAQLNAIMLTPVADGETLTEILKDPRINALCLGPGLGQNRARDLVPVALAARRATVLDADALTAFADAPEQLFDQLHPNCVLTPHSGEFARLFPDIAQTLAAPIQTGPAPSKLDATRAAAKRAGCTVLFKGADTVIADPSGQVTLNVSAYDRATPWLATAGSGDTLAGFITGLMARGTPALMAAETGAWLHTECAKSFGPGLIAEDIPEELPKVLKSLGA